MDIEGALHQMFEHNGVILSAWMWERSL